MSMLDDDDDLVCPSTGGGDRYASQATRLGGGREEADDGMVDDTEGPLLQDDDDDDEKLADEVADRRREQELTSAGLQATEHEASLQAKQSHVDTRNVLASAAKRQVVPLNIKPPSARGTVSSGSSVVGSSSRRGSESSRVVGLEEELRSLANQVRVQDSSIRQHLQESEKQKKLLNSLSARVERDAVEKQALDQKVRLLETQLAAARKELLLAQRQLGAASNAGAAPSSSPSTAAGADDVRLKRALQEIESLRQQLAAASASPSEHQSELNLLRTENKKLDAQRLELVTCIRKQNKLIDVLKRQKIHLEAAKLLQITEEEFLRSLEVNQK